MMQYTTKWWRNKEPLCTYQKWGLLLGIEKPKAKSTLYTTYKNMKLNGPYLIHPQKLTDAKEFLTLNCLRSNFSTASREPSLKEVSSSEAKNWRDMLYNSKKED